MALDNATAAADIRTDELRLALVLNGGVSLAVWMGGVAFELNRLVRETHPVYEGLLKLTGTVARIDVISGTSAGGINGAALALAQVYDRSLYSLRDVWLETAGLDRLLRDPDDKDPSSLLQGDTWFLPQIRRAFAELAQGKPSVAAGSPLFLSLTTTLLGGQIDKRLDDFGATVEDTVHRALWRYERSEGPGNDAFVHPRIVDQLAFAARSTASFPVAFEPARYDPADPMYVAAPLLKVRQSPEAVLLKPALLLDGGILDNRPFDAALDGIARLPAQGNTRRVLAYIAPDPSSAGERPEQAKAPGAHRDDLDAPPPPTLAQVAWRSLVTIPMAQSIAGNLAVLRQHNFDASRRWQRLVGAMRHVKAQQLQLNAIGAFPAYQARRVEGITSFYLDEIEAGLAEFGSGDFMSMRRATRQWLSSTWQATHRETPSIWAGRVPVRYAPAEPLLLGPPPDAQAWPWGLYALDFAVELSVELLRRTQRLSALVGRWSSGAGATEPPVALPEPRIPGPGAYWEQLDAGRSVGHASSAERLSSGTELHELWKQAYALAHAVRERRRHAVEEAKEVGAKGFRNLVDEWRLRGGQDAPLLSAINLLRCMLAVQSEEEAENARYAREVFELIAALREEMDKIIAAYQQRTARAEIDEALEELKAIRAYLYEPLHDGAADAADPADRIAWRVLALEVFEVSAGSREHAPNAQAEVVQISGRLASAWGGSDDPAAKLNGMQLGHFGAFYKRSWRANDWTFGRLDGIDRAIRIALNPDALQRRFGDRHVGLDAGNGLPNAAAYVGEYIYALAVDSAEAALKPVLQKAWDADRARIVEELAWLDHPSSLPPPVLEHCAAALARRLQLEALRRELPDIATSLISERQAGTEPSEIAGVKILARVAPDGQPRVPTPEHAIELIGADLLGSETLGGQVGSELFTRTTSQALATAHAAFSSRYGGLNAVNVLFKITEWPVRILYWLANRLSRSGSTGAAIEGAVLGVGLALVAAGLLAPKLPRAALALGWALLAGAIGTTMLRRPPIGWTIVFLVLAGVAFIDPTALLQALLVVAAVVCVLRFTAGSWLAMAIVIVLAAYWSADVSSEGLKTLWNLHHGSLGPAISAAAPDDFDEQMQRLRQAMVPALVLVVVVLLASLARGGSLPLARRKVAATGVAAAQPLRGPRRWLRRCITAGAAFATAWRREGKRP